MKGRYTADRQKGMEAHRGLHSAHAKGGAVSPGPRAAGAQFNFLEKCGRSAPPGCAIQAGEISMVALGVAPDPLVEAERMSPTTED